MSRISFTVRAFYKSIYKSFMQRDTKVVTRSWTISLNYDLRLYIKLHEMRLAHVVYTSFFQTTSQRPLNCEFLFLRGQFFDMLLKFK
jgi:hypothetical protein